jgi:fatty acid desaturase
MSNTKKKNPPYIWWATVFTSAALLGFFIGGVVPWWAFLVPWVIYGSLVLLFLGLVFVIGFVSIIAVAMAEEIEKRKRERK